MKKGFTLLEVLVASMLLGMLVTILTMVFNQSSVAWRTGISGVADLDDRRQCIAAMHSLADAALPNAAGGGSEYRIVSPWNTDGGALRSRAVEKIPEGAKSQISKGGADIDFNRPDTWVNRSVGGSMDSGTLKAFVVGVVSAGPDRQFNTKDDITTLPKESSK